jgi:hypothetical protein
MKVAGTRELETVVGTLAVEAAVSGQTMAFLLLQVRQRGWLSHL